jgi:hypothetical protein
MRETPEKTAFAEGRRDMGLHDLALIMRLCPEQYTRMAAEQQPGPDPRTSGHPTPGDDDGE